jgi:nucleotide-binding universal stress UspA family protein
MAARAKTRYSVSALRGLPSVETCHAANEDANVIIISTHGRTGVRNALVGSVTEYVVRYAHCPVLVIPARPNAVNSTKLTAKETFPSGL